MARLAHRVAELPSTAFFAAQHAPSEEETTGWLRDRLTSAAGAAAGCAEPAYAMAPVSAAIVTAAAPASTVSHFVRRFTLPPTSANLFTDVHE